MNANSSQQNEFFFINKLLKGKISKTFKNHPVEPIMWDELSQIRVAHIRRVSSKEKINLHLQLHPFSYLGISCSSFSSFPSPPQQFKHPASCAATTPSFWSCALPLLQHWPSAQKYKLLRRLSAPLNEVVLTEPPFSRSSRSVPYP